MAALIIMVCLISNPNECHNEQLLSLSLPECATQGPELISAWLAENPKYKMVAWTCLVDET